jgi:hypothetical protein
VPIGKALTAKIFFLEGVTLDHGTHGAIENQNSLLCCLPNFICHMLVYASDLLLHQNILMDEHDTKVF